MTRRSLALALVGEVGELVELLQWLPADRALNASKHRIGSSPDDAGVECQRSAESGAP